MSKIKKNFDFKKFRSHINKRDVHRLNLCTLRNRLGVDYPTFQRIETGKHDITEQQYIIIVEFLELHPESLLVYEQPSIW